MSQQELVLPALKPADWKGQSQTICRPLITIQGQSGFPWLAFGYDRPHTFEFLTRREDQVISAAQLKLIEQAALANLHNRPATWESREFKLGGRDSLRVLICDNDYLAAERIVDKEFMQQAHQQLKARQLIVGIPYRGLLLAIDRKQDQAMLAGFGGTVVAQYRQAQSAAPISPLLFVLEEGAIVGAGRTTIDEAAQEMAEAENQAQSQPYISAMVTREKETDLETLHILAGGEDIEVLADHIINALARGMQKMDERGRFGGEVKVIIIPDLTPRTPSLDADLDSLEGHLRGIAAELRIQPAGGRPIKVSIQYGDGNVPSQ